MDPNQNQNFPQDQVEQQMPQQSVKVQTKNSLKKVLLVFLGILVLLGVAGGSYYLGTQQNHSSLIAGVTKNIHIPFSKPTSTPTPTSIPTATPTPNPTANWQVYANSKYQYSIKYPTAFTPNEVETYYYYVEFKPTGSLGALPPFVISVIPETFVAKDPAAYNYMSSDWIDNISNIAVGMTKTMDSAATFTRLPDTTVMGKTAQVIEVDATGYKQHRVYVRNNGNIYMISNYYQSVDELNNFALFLSTFKFTQ